MVKNQGMMLTFLRQFSETFFIYIKYYRHYLREVTANVNIIFYNISKISLYEELSFYLVWKQQKDCSSVFYTVSTVNV